MEVFKRLEQVTEEVEQASEEGDVQRLRELEAEFSKTMCSEGRDIHEGNKLYETAINEGMPVIIIFYI